MSCIFFQTGLFRAVNGIPEYRVWNSAADTIYLVCPLIISAIYWQMLAQWGYNEGRRKRWADLAIAVIASAGILLALGNALFGYYSSVGEDGRYFRGELFVLTIVIPLLMVVLCVGRITAGGTWKGKKDPQTFTIGKDGKGFDLTEEPVWKGHVFIGWRKTKTGDNSYTFEAVWDAPTRSDEATDPDGITRGDPPVKKIVTGKGAPRDDLFTFELKAVNNTAGLDKNPMPGDASGQTMRVKLAAGEEKEFGVIEFSAPGTYNYVIREVNDGDADYEYDESVYKVSYEVTREDSGLKCVRTFQKDGKDVDIAVFEFNNTYTGGSDDADDKNDSSIDRNSGGNGSGSSGSSSKTGDEANITLWFFALGTAL